MQAGVESLYFAVLDEKYDTIRRFRSRYILIVVFFDTPANHPLR